ncbi:AT-hook motif nuclear-localized protein 20, partial [Striga asiatica]
KITPKLNFFHNFVFPPNSSSLYFPSSLFKIERAFSREKKNHKFTFTFPQPLPARPPHVHCRGHLAGSGPHDLRPRPVATSPAPHDLAVLRNFSLTVPLLPLKSGFFILFLYFFESEFLLFLTLRVEEQAEAAKEAPNALRNHLLEIRDRADVSSCISAFAGPAAVRSRFLVAVGLWPM